MELARCSRPFYAWRSANRAIIGVYREMRYLGNSNRGIFLVELIEEWNFFRFQFVSISGLGVLAPSLVLMVEASDAHVVKIVDGRFPVWPVGWLWWWTR
jgi:hypothetical protein